MIRVKRLLPFYLQNRNREKYFPGTQRGFTLIEVIICLLIVGILGVFTTIGFIRIIKGYMFSRENTDIALKGQVAVARIVKEVRSIEKVTNGKKRSIVYNYNLNGDSVNGRTLSWTGSDSNPLMLGKNVLVDGVADFEITYYDDFKDAGDHVWNGQEKMIGITLRLNSVSGRVASFSIRVMPFNL